MHFTQGLGKMSLMTAELAPTRVVCGGTGDYCPPLVYAPQTLSPNPETSAPVSTIFWLHYCAIRGSGEMSFICFCHFKWFDADDQLHPVLLEAGHIPSPASLVVICL